MKCVLHGSLYQDNMFLTLTHDEKREGYHNELDYKEIQDFKKRYRERVSYHENKKIEIFNVHEYGKNGKKHWHLVVFNHEFKDKTVHTSRNGIPLYSSADLADLWPFGFNTIGTLTEASAMYTAQYMQKDFKHNYVKTGKASKSVHRGIGTPYFLRHFEQVLRLGYVPYNGRRCPIPRSFLKVAHRHYSHYFEPENFFDNSRRKRLYTPFSEKKRPNYEIAYWFREHLTVRADFIRNITEEWEAWVDEHAYSKDKPEFERAVDNALYDLRNKNNLESF